MPGTVPGSGVIVEDKSDPGPALMELTLQKQAVAVLCDHALMQRELGDPWGRRDRWTGLWVCALQSGTPGSKFWLYIYWLGDLG